MSAGRHHFQKVRITVRGELVSRGKAKRAAQALHDIGFAHVAVIQGGCRGWQAAGHELVPVSSTEGDRR